MYLLNEIIPRKLTIEQQKEYAKHVARYDLVDYLVEQGNIIQNKYDYAVFINAKNEVENYKVMLNIIDEALKFSLN